jgi:predicted membrane protein
MKPFYGPAFWVNIAYSYSLIFAGVYLFLRKALELGRNYARQGAILASGVMIPIIGNIIYLR